MKKKKDNVDNKLPLNDEHQLTPEKLLKGISRRDSKKEGALTLDTREQKSSMALLKERGYADKLEMRREWSDFMQKIVLLIILFQILFLIMIGNKTLSFDVDLAKILLPGIFVEIIGLVWIILNFLFPGRK